MQEAMPDPNFKGGEKNQDIGSDEKTLKKINKLEDKWKKLQNQIDNTSNEEKKQVLKFDKEDLEKIIRQQYKYYDRVCDNKELNDLREKSGEKNVAAVIDFQKAKKRIKKEKIVDPKIKKQFGEKFLSDFEKFKKERNI
ncbi:hypothetical protein K8R61_00955 [bacterium]|nr:hypothetical protein [bacterium]